MRYLHRPFAYRALPVVANSDNDNQGSQSHDYCTPPFSPIRTVIMYICFRYKWHIYSDIIISVHTYCQNYVQMIFFQKSMQISVNEVLYSTIIRIGFLQ